MYAHEAQATNKLRKIFIEQYPSLDGRVQNPDKHSGVLKLDWVTLVQVHIEEEAVSLQWKRKYGSSKLGVCDDIGKIFMDGALEGNGELWS